MPELRTFAEIMHEGAGWDSYANYAGDTSDHHFYYVISQNRDSDVLARSNFRSALERLGGESDDVHLNHLGHWAVGWVEHVLINPERADLVKVAEEIHEALDGYPVLDDDDFSELEQEERDEDYASWGRRDTVEAIAKWAGVEPSELEELCEAEWPGGLEHVCCRVFDYYSSDHGESAAPTSVPDVERCLDEVAASWVEARRMLDALADGDAVRRWLDGERDAMAPYRINERQLELALPEETT